MKDINYSFVWSFAIAMAFTLLFAIVLLLNGGKAHAAGEFVTTWRTHAGHWLDDTLVIPTHSGSTYNYTVDWGDGNVDSGVTGDASHTYADAGTYTVKISGEFPRIYVNFHTEASYKLLSVESWGNLAWSSMNHAFAGAQNLEVNAADSPDLSNVTDLMGMFKRAPYVNSDFSNWDVSGVENFSELFWGATRFNQPLNAWDVSSALNMDALFREVPSFNQPLDSWDVSSVTSMVYMFLETNSFNQDLSSWRIPNVVSTEYMFYNSSLFNQDLSEWDVDSLERASLMFTNTSLSSENYDAILQGWSEDDVQQNVNFTLVGATYCNGTLARHYLTHNMLWNITDDGVESVLCAPTDVLFDGQDPIVVGEEQDAVTVLGTFSTVDVDVDETFTYSLTCTDQYPDSLYFSFNGNELATNQVFDFDNPLDENGDNMYEICIVSQDSKGFRVEKEFSIEVTEEEEVEVSGGAVLGASTDDPNDPDPNGGQVLADTDGAVLADTGNSTIFTALAGLAVAVAGYIVFQSRLRVVYSFYRQ